MLSLGCTWLDRSATKGDFFLSLSIAAAVFFGLNDSTSSFFETVKLAVIVIRESTTHVFASSMLVKAFLLLRKQSQNLGHNYYSAYE